MTHDDKKKKTEIHSENCEPDPSELVTDGRCKYETETGYVEEDLKKIRRESIFLFVVLFVSLGLLLLNITGQIVSLLQLEGVQANILQHYLTYFLSGILGGILFGMKIFYRYVAKGRWHLDRRYWRIMSPFIAGAIALVIGSMAEVGVVDEPNGWSILVGFLAGYFADRAVGKMIDVAKVLFGEEESKKDC